jgi:hypothetical protein
VYKRGKAGAGWFIGKHKIPRHYRRVKRKDFFMVIKLSDYEGKGKGKKAAFTQLPNRAAQDANLSWAARGLLVYMLSRPNDWEFYITELYKASLQGRTATDSAIKELIQAGYIYKQKQENRRRGAALHVSAAILLLEKV